jgi:cysteine synthase
VAKRLVQEGRGGVIVTIVADGATKYLSEPFWNED